MSKRQNSTIANTLAGWLTMRECRVFHSHFKTSVQFLWFIVLSCYWNTHIHVTRWYELVLSVSIYIAACCHCHCCRCRCRHVAVAAVTVAMWSITIISICPIRQYLFAFAPTFYLYQVAPLLISVHFISLVTYSWQAVYPPDSMNTARVYTILFDFTYSVLQRSWYQVISFAILKTDGIK